VRESESEREREREREQRSKKLERKTGIDLQRGSFSHRTDLVGCTVETSWYVYEY